MTRPEPKAPWPVRRIASLLETAGFETWAVGGAVRDVLLGSPSGDWDLTTRARPKDVRRIFRRTVPIGIDHGTVGVLIQGVLYEVTTFRRDVETDGRHAVVAFSDTVEEDLARRDFTINAIAWHPLRKVWLDPFGGVADLEAGVLRAVGEPAERFAEDHLRVLRALRFAGRFGLEVDGATWVALCGAAEHLTTLSAERIREELLKVLDADRTPSTAMGLYARSGSLTVLYPELEALRAGSETEWRETLATVDHLPPGRPLLRLSALLRHLEPAAAAGLLLRLRLSNADSDETARRAGAPPLPATSASDGDVRRWLSRVGATRLAAVARLELARARAAGDPGEARTVAASWRRLREVRRGGPPLTVADLAVDGRDLIGMGMKPGPHFGELLESLLDWVLDDPGRNEPELLRERIAAMAETSSTAEDV